jgi:hypothetical protein
VATTAGTAAAGTDFVPLPEGSVLSFPAGATEASVAVEVQGDAVDEPDETFTVTIGDGDRATTVTADVATVTVSIVDDDATTAPPSTTPGGSTGSSPLARTGADPRGSLAIGLGLVLAGLALVVGGAGWRRRTTTG